MAQDRDPSKPAGPADLAEDLLDELVEGVDATFAPDLVMDASGELKSIDDGLTTIPDPTQTDPSLTEPIEVTEPLPSPELELPHPVPRRLSAQDPDFAAPPAQALDPFAGLQVPDDRPVPRIGSRCRVLVVSDDPNTGRALTERLKQIGAEGRAVTLSGISQAQGQTWDVLLVVLTTEEARRDAGRGRLRKLSVLPLPTVLLAPEPMSPPEPHVVACLEVPPLPEELAAAMEAALQPARPEPAPVDPTGPAILPLPPGLPPPAPESDDLATQQLHAPDQPVPLDVNIVRALVLHGPEDRSRGRVRSLARSGKMHVDLKRPIESGRRVQVRLVRPNGESRVFSGRVLSASVDACEIQLELSDSAGFVHAYVREAVDVTLPVPEQVTIEVQLVTEMETVSDEELLRRWAKVQTQLDDDSIQQAFIQECIKAQKLDLAVRCYRELKEAHPEDGRIQKYLNQVGTILSFYALRRESVSDESSGMSKRVKVVLGLFIGAAVFLVLIALLVS